MYPSSSQNLTRLRNEATALRNRQEFQRSQLTELKNTDFESWAKESFEIATKIAYRNGGPIGTTFAGIRDSVKELVGQHMDSLAQKFVRNHDMKVKDEIERLAREYGKLKEPWEFVSR